MRIIVPTGAIVAALLLATSPAQASGPVAIAAEACFGCHGPQGVGVTGGAAIAGRDRAELVTILAAFRSNERPGTIMGRIVRGYTEAELAAIADHLSRLR
jgi:sulfide dehydrogenase cytochrome subunit